MKILVTGAHGQLGTELKTILEKGESELGSLPQACQGCQVTAVDSDVLDITDQEVVLKYIGEGGYGVVLNCAAMTNVDACEAHEDVAYRVNALGAENLAKACKANGARLVHVSTDYVFSGDGGAPYREDDPTGPLGAYGRTKLAGEKLVLEADPDAVVCRTAWLYGYVGNNFPKKIMKLAGGKGRLKVVTDQKGDPTCAVDLAFQMVTLAASKENGIFHCTCEGGPVSRYGFTQAILEEAGIGCIVEPCLTRDFPRAAAVPADSSLSKGKLEGLGLYVMRPWRDALRKWMRTYLEEVSRG
jgi:dTDP-4-dehydrorhamnose reductase